MHVFAARATLVTAATLKPTDALQAMVEHGTTHASGTPTFWRFLLAAARGLELPPLVQITLGGEAVPPDVLDDLRTAFPDARISQIYAATEFGQTGSVRDDLHGLPASVLERGDDADVAMKVVDGELWVRSRVGMLGYYGEEPVDPDGWRPSGDLVEVVDGRIRFVGRTSETINVGGVKVHPLPIEERVSKVPGVVGARVFGRPNRLTGHIVAVEFIADDTSDPDDLKEAIRDACSDLPAAANPRSIRQVDSLPTLGGKILRRTHE